MDIGTDNKINRMKTAEAESVFRKFQYLFLCRYMVKGFLIATRFLSVRFLRIIGLPFVLLFIILNFKNYIAIRKNLLIIKPGVSAFSYSYMAFDVFKNYSYLSYRPISFKP